VGIIEEGQELITACIHYVFLEVNREQLPVDSPITAAYLKVLA